MRFRNFMIALAAAICCWGSAQAAFIVQPDIDGSSAGSAVTFNPLLSFGNGTGPAGVGGSTPATAAGLLPANSIFGGASTTVDQYIYSYTPGTNADNASFTSGQALGNGNTATGVTGGTTGTYKVYAVWPNTANISDLGTVPTNYVASSDTAPAVAGLNQDEDTNGALVGGVWALIGTVDLTAGTTYTVTQTAPNSSFVSMRAAGIMWELQPGAEVPEPASVALIGLACLGLFVVRRRAA